MCCMHGRHNKRIEAGFPCERAPPTDSPPPMATFELLDSSSDLFVSPVALAPLRIDDAAPLAVGRELLAELREDKRLSRKQLTVSAANGTVSVQRTGPNASYLQVAAGAAPIELPRDAAVWTKVPSGGIIWLTAPPRR